MQSSKRASSVHKSTAIARNSVRRHVQLASYQVMKAHRIWKTLTWKWKQRRELQLKPTTSCCLRLPCRRSLATLLKRICKSKLFTGRTLTVGGKKHR